MKTLPDNPLELAILLYKNMQDRGFDSGELSGVIPCDFDFEAITTQLNSELINKNAAKRYLEFHVPGHAFFADMDSLLENVARRLTPPIRFYLADIDYLYQGDQASAPNDIRNYLSATKLYALLEKAADLSGGVASAKTLIFLQKEKIEITPSYSASDLRELTGVDDFQVEFIESEAHKTQKQTIVKTVLLEMFTGRCQIPFAEFLARFGDFMEKVRASYQLYVAEFSFQKVKAEIDKEKLDATIKLNKVFSDIQNQLLAVPVALILVGGQMENKGEWLSKNVLIWLGALVFSVLMSLLIRNQRHTLAAVKQEIDQQWEEIRGRHHSVADRFNKSYSELGDRYKHQSRLIWVVDGLVALSLAVTTCLLVHYSVAIP